MLKTLRNRVVQVALDHQKRQPKTIVFEAYQGSSYACSPRALYEYMQKDPRFDEYCFVWALRHPEKYKFLLDNKNTSIVEFRSFAYYLTYARAEFWIVNGWLPEMLHKKPGQIMLQCWHGTPLKKMRNDIPVDSEALPHNHEEMRKKDEIDTLRYDYFISPSRFATEKFTSAFRLRELGREDIVLETGYPRNDFLHIFTEEDVKNSKRRLGIPEDKKTLLYAPTWRDDQRDENGFTYKLDVDFELLREKLADDYVILFRAHYNVMNGFDFEKYKDFIFNVSEVDDINDLYIISDVLVTDYSSSMFDYANLGRPMVFFMYDLERYQNKLRGFYFDVNELPGDIVQTEDGVIVALNDLTEYQQKYAEKYDAFCKKFTYLDDGHASRRVIDDVFFGGDSNA